MIRFDEDTTLADFLDRDVIENRTELLLEVNDYLLTQMGDADDAGRRQLTDWMLSLRELRNDLKQIGRTENGQRQL